MWRYNFSYLTLIYFLSLLYSKGQNLISNSSFSEIQITKNNALPHKILPGSLSNIKDWYLLSFLDYKSAHKDGSVLYSSTYYYRSADADFMLKKGDLSYLYPKFDNNLGYLRMYLNNKYPVAIIQQKLKYGLPSGKYCFKFRYKYSKFNSEYRIQKCKLEFSLSKSNLQEFYKNKILRVPDSLIQIAFKDTINDIDENTPWQKMCYVININGNEKYLTIGTLSNLPSINSSWAHYFIDDIELYPINSSDQCQCEILNKDLSKMYTREFPVNHEISNDTLVMDLPNNGFVPGAISKEAKNYLFNIISFMQRNVDVKIKWIQYERFNNPTSSPSSAYYNMERFLCFYGIDKNRISVENGLCTDTTGMFCGHTAKYLKFGFKLYKE